MNDEKALIQRLKDGDQQAFKELVNQYQQMVFRVAYTFLNNQEEAEDVAQEVFISVYENIQYFREESNLKTWLYRITVNKSINQQKKIKWKNNLLKIEEMLKVQHPVLSDIHDPYKNMINSEKYFYIEKAIDKLPQNQRIAFILHKIEDLPQTEIARVMNLSVSAVESLIHRAKLNLQKYLGTHFFKYY